MKKTTTCFIASLVLVAGMAGAKTPDLPLETEARELETLLIAPCCWRQPISDHQSAIAGQMKDEIRQMLQEGRNRQEILDHYIEQYGVRILSIPPQEGFNRMSFVMPVVFVMVGLAVVGVLLQRWRRHDSGPSPEDDGVVVSEEMSRRIQKELDELD